MNRFLPLTAPQTCKRLNEASGEHQTWLNQVARLRIPIPTGVVLPAAELKDRAVSWLRSDRLWVKPRDDNNDRPLNLRCFMLRDDDDEDVPFVMARLLPGGRFVVVVGSDGRIDLKEINIKSEGGWELLDVAEYRLDDPEQYRGLWSSQLLMETGLGYPLVAYVNPGKDEYDCSFARFLHYAD